MQNFLVFDGIRTIILYAGSQLSVYIFIVSLLLFWIFFLNLDLVTILTK